jgi:hypothetical protein
VLINHYINARGSTEEDRMTKVGRTVITEQRDTSLFVSAGPPAASDVIPHSTIICEVWPYT